MIMLRSFGHILVLRTILVILTDTQMQGKLKVTFLEARGKTEIEKGLLPTECQQMIHVKYVIFLST